MKRVPKTERDGAIERLRYNRAADVLRTTSTTLRGSEALAPLLRGPIQEYETAIRRIIKPEFKVLELGAGSGSNTIFNETVALYIALDVADVALQINSATSDTIKPVCSDMASLPFNRATFDLILSAGALSYADFNSVRNELVRVLKPGGFFIAIDSLNHNPIYRLNRYRHYLSGLRTLSTLRRMPTMSTLELLKQDFVECKVTFHGHLTFLAPFLRRTFGTRRTQQIIYSLDDVESLRRLAFKFVVTCRKQGSD